MSISRKTLRAEIHKLERLNANLNILVGEADNLAARTGDLLKKPIHPSCAVGCQADGVLKRNAELEEHLAEAAARVHRHVTANEALVTELQLCRAALLEIRGNFGGDAGVGMPVMPFAIWAAHEVASAALRNERHPLMGAVINDWTAAYAAWLAAGRPVARAERGAPPPSDVICRTPAVQAEPDPS